MRRRKICKDHDDILDLIADIEDLIDILETSKKSITNRIKRKLIKIYDLTLHAKDSGQSMENRLSQYRHRIEDLGFRRARG